MGDGMDRKQILTISMVIFCTSMSINMVPDEQHKIGNKGVISSTSSYFFSFYVHRPGQLALPHQARNPDSVALRV